jgi:hypothetical protein
MRIINNNYIDQELADFLNQLNSNNTRPTEGSKLFYLTNCTVPRLTPDFVDKKVSRCIKKELATHVVYDNISFKNYPRYWDNRLNLIVNGETDNSEVVYSIDNSSPAQLKALEQIIDFHNFNNTVIYVHQNTLNDVLNNGLIIDSESVHNLERLLESDNTENISIVTSLIESSSMKDNLEWILYLFYGKEDYITDKIYKYLASVNISNENLYYNNFKRLCNKITSPEVKNYMLQRKRKEFNDKLKDFLFQIAADNLDIKDFVLEYGEN